MSRDTLLIVCRTPRGRSVAETHGERLRRRDVVDAVEVLRYEREPGRELRDQLRAVDADRTFATALRLAHSRETTDAIPAALSHVPGTVEYCGPVGRSPAITRAALARATDRVPAAADASLVLVGFGASGTPYHRQTVEHHAERVRHLSDYGEVVPCYLLQNPTVECVRYNVTNDRVVAVPLFVEPSDATADEIPAKLELDRGGVAYADPLGAHPLVTDAIESEIAARRVLADGDGQEPRTFEATLTARARAVVADGEGRRPE